MRKVYCWVRYLTRPSWDNRRHDWLRIWPLIDVPMPEGRYDQLYRCQRCGHVEAYDTFVADSVDEQIESARFNNHWNLPSI